MDSRRNHYNYIKYRKEKFIEQLHKLLGGICHNCADPAPTRIEFIDISDPRRLTYQNSRVTLHRKILDGEINSNLFKLLCSDCWIQHRREFRDGQTQESQS